MTNKERFLAGHSFYIRGSRVIYRNDISAGELPAIQILRTDYDWVHYASVKDIDTHKFTAYSSLFHELVYVNIHFQQLIFIELKGGPKS